MKWDYEMKVLELDTSVFIIPGERIKNGEERLVVLNRVAKSVVERLRGLHHDYVFARTHKKDAKPRPVNKINNTAWKAARERAADSWQQQHGESAPMGFRRIRVHDLKHTFGRRLRAAAESAARAWLALVDAGNYDESWSAASALFRQRAPKSQWQSAASNARGPLGALKSRTLQSATFKSSLPGAPDGVYVIVQFACSFENKASAIETVTPMKDPDGTWRVWILRPVERPPTCPSGPPIPAAHHRQVRVMNVGCRAPPNLAV